MSILNKAYERKSEISVFQALGLASLPDDTEHSIASNVAAPESSTPTWRHLSLDVSSQSLWMIFAMWTLCPALWASDFNGCLGIKTASLTLRSKRKMLHSGASPITLLWNHPESFQNVPVPRPHSQRSWSLGLEWGPNISIFKKLPSCF